MTHPFIFVGQTGRLLRRPVGFAIGESGDVYTVTHAPDCSDSTYLKFSVKVYVKARGYWVNQSYCSDLGLYDTEFAPEELKNNVGIFFK